MVKQKYGHDLAVWLLLFFSLFLSSAFAAWQLLGKLDFLYPLGYQLLDIEENISRFAPANRYKQNFQLTDTAEHYRIFGEIVREILNRGTTLEKIHYRTPEGEIIDTLLTQAEVTHLRDVANLTTKILLLGIASLILLFALIAWQKYTRHLLPSLLRIHLIGAGLLLACIAITLLFGAEKTFYAAHTWIFPADHQWFFYYEESLMTTLMKAPDLFAVIAFELLVTTLLFYGLGLFFLRRLFYNP